MNLKYKSEILVAVFLVILVAMVSGDGGGSPCFGGGSMVQE